MNEEWERSELAPWNRNQSDELERPAEYDEGWANDDDLPDFEDEDWPDDDDYDDFLEDDEDDYLPPWPEWCDVCQGPCRQA